MNKETLYSSLQDQEHALENKKRALDAALKTVRADMERLKAEIIADYTEHGVCPESVIFKQVPPKPIVTDESKLPERFFRIEKKVNKTAINEAIKNGEEIEGVTMDNGGLTIAIKAHKG